MLERPYPRMSGAMARKPRLAKHGSWCRQLMESSGQPCTKMITGRCAPPQAREKVVCLALLAICSVTGNDMETFLPVPRLMRGTAGNVVRCIKICKRNDFGNKPPREESPRERLQWCLQSSQCC